MNFTRDPIIETVITPREGCKLVVRSSKGTNQEDYLVDALEVVSFGHSFFFRSIERPKSFLVPVSDYEVFESKEPKMALKNTSADRSIKIGGGRDAAPRQQREAPSSEEAPSQHMDRGPMADRKQRDKQRRRGRRGRDRNDSYAPQQQQEETFSPREELPEVSEEAMGQAEVPKEKAPSFISKLFPPPSTLIKDTMSRYKTIDPAAEDLFPEKEPISLEDFSSYEEGNSGPKNNPLTDEDSRMEE